MKTHEILSAFIQTMNDIYFPGYVSQMTPQAFEFEFAQFKSQFQKPVKK